MITWLGILFSLSSVNIDCVSDHEFVLSVPQVLQHDLVLHDQVLQHDLDAGHLTNTFYSPPVTRPSVFYQVPSLQVSCH